MDLLPSEIARLVWAYLSDFDELKPEAEAFLQKCPDLRELSRHLKRGGRMSSRKVNEKTLQDHLNDINKPSITTIEFDEQKMIGSMTESIEKLLNSKLSLLSEKTDFEKQRKDIENMLNKLTEEHWKFDRLHQTLNEQFVSMGVLLKDIVEQNHKITSSIGSFNDQMNKFIHTYESSSTLVKHAKADKCNDFKYLEDKIKVEISNKSQYVTSFILNEFVNLKSLLESIVNSNYERIQQSTNHLKNTNQEFQTSKSHLHLGQETPPSESCRNETENNAITTPTSSEILSQSPSYSDLSLGDLISDNTRADLNRQISQAVCLAANSHTEKYADLITNVLYKSSSSGSITGLIFTPQKPSVDCSENLAVPQTPCIQDIPSGSGNGNSNNFCLNFNLVKLIDDILQSNSPLKNCLGPKCAQLSTQKLFPATPDITLDITPSMQEGFKKPDPVVKNFSNILKTPKPKNKENSSKKDDALIVDDNDCSNKSKEANCSADVVVEPKEQQLKVGNEGSDEPNIENSQDMEEDESLEEAAIDDGKKSGYSIGSHEQEAIVSIPAPVFANQHMVTRSSPQYPVTVTERISPIKSVPLNDLTMSIENSQDECFKKPANNSMTRTNRIRAQKFASNQERIRYTLQHGDTSLTQQQHQPQQQQRISQPSHQVLVQDVSNNLVYAIDPNQTLICVNDLDGNTYLQQAPAIEHVFYQHDLSSGTLLPASSVSSGSGLATAISATSVEMPSISISTFDGSPVTVPTALDTSNSSSSSSSSSVIACENKITGTDQSQTGKEKGSAEEKKKEGVKTRKRKKVAEESQKDNKAKNKQAKSSKALTLCQDFEEFLRSQQ